MHLPPRRHPPEPPQTHAQTPALPQFHPRHRATKWPISFFSAVPSCAGECRFVRGDSVGNYATDPDLWGFCGARTRSSTRFPGHQEHLGNANGAARRAGPDRGASFSAAASSCGVIMLSWTTGTCASCYRRHARHLDEQQSRSPHFCPPPIQEKHSPPIPLTPASTRNTPPADPGIPATASDHARDATDGQHAPTDSAGAMTVIRGGPYAHRSSRSGVPVSHRASVARSFTLVDRIRECSAIPLASP